MNETYEYVSKEVDKKFPNNVEKITNKVYKTAIQEIDDLLNQLQKKDKHYKKRNTKAYT